MVGTGLFSQLVAHVSAVEHDTIHGDEDKISQAVANHPLVSLKPIDIASDSPIKEETSNHELKLECKVVINLFLLAFWDALWIVRKNLQTVPNALHRRFVMQAVVLQRLGLS